MVVIPACDMESGSLSTMVKEVNGSLAPLSITIWMSGGGLFCLVHTAVSWQEGINSPILKLSTLSLVICSKSKHEVRTQAVD